MCVGSPLGTQHTLIFKYIGQTVPDLLRLEVESDFGWTGFFTHPLKVILSKPNDETGGGVRTSVIRNSTDFEIASGTNIDTNLRECYANLWAKAEQLAVRGSG